MKPSLQLKLSTQLTLTPQLQQSIKLLQLSTLELEQEIERVLLENPMLERIEGDDSVEPTADDSSAATAEQQEQGAEREPATADELPAADEDSTAAIEQQHSDEGPDWSSLSSPPPARRDDDDDSDFQDFHAAEVSLRDHLDQQLALSPLSDTDRTLARFLIEALDEDGYLHQPLEELLELLPPELGLGLDDLVIALHHIQHLDPAGVGARSASECLSLQLQALPPTPEQTLALAITSDHLEVLAERNFNRLKKLLGCNDDELRAAHALICELDPRPGLRYGGSAARYIVPDVIVRKVGGRWQASLNQEALPRLRINRLYADLLQQHRNQSSGLSGQLQEARWLIRNVRQRFDTILRVAQAIVDQQSQFFDHGEVAMRPLTLREIADELELHESTISRVTTQKFMATPRGVLELKYFFGSHVATDSGGAASSTAIRALIRQLVDAEDSKKPLSDSRISALLGEQGIVIARRTVAKYRESLNIPAVSQRKSI